MMRKISGPVKDAKKKAFALFDQGKTTSDPEVKALGLTPSTRWKYFSDWKKKTSQRQQKSSSKLQKKPVAASVVASVAQSEAPPVVAPVVASVAQGEVIATCPVCSQVVPRRQLFKHMWNSHHDYMIEQTRKGGQTKQARKAEAKVTTKKQPTTTAKMETLLPGGESVFGIEEHDDDTAPAATTATTEKKPRVEGLSDEFIEGEALWIKAKVNAKTLTYYQLFASRVRSQNHDANVTLGDFLDVVADDYFKGRNLSLGLIKLNKEN